jgi:hypothetical protein
MKLEVGPDQSIILSEVFSGVGIKTDMGTFGVCQRDGGIEVTREGVQVFSMYPDGRFDRWADRWAELCVKYHKLREALRLISEAPGGGFDEIQVALQALEETE